MCVTGEQYIIPIELKLNSVLLVNRYWSGEITAKNNISPIVEI